MLSSGLRILMLLLEVMVLIYPNYGKTSIFHTIEYVRNWNHFSIDNFSNLLLSRDYEGVELSRHSKCYKMKSVDICTFSTYKLLQIYFKTKSYKKFKLWFYKHVVNNHTWNCRFRKMSKNRSALTNMVDLQMNFSQMAEVGSFIPFN